LRCYALLDFDETRVKFGLLRPSSAQNLARK